MNTKYYILGLLLGFSLTIVSQDLLFQHLKVDDGLSQSSVQSIYQDELDNMWIATRDGINKFDGNKIEVFRPIIGDTTGLFGNNIQTVCGDHNGHVFIQCLTGLVIYSLKKQTMEIIKRNGVECISHGKERLWIGCKDSIKYFNIQKKSIKFFCNLENEIKINKILEASDGTLYVGSQQNGLYIVDKNKKIRTLLPKLNIICLYEDDQKNIWIGTVDSGIYRIDRQNTLIHYMHDEKNKNSISDNYVRAICQDDLGNFWIGTFKGIDHFNPGTGVFTHHTHSEKDPYSIGSSSVWAITKDTQGSLWIGTYFKGVDRINPEFSFNQYYRSNENGNGLSSPIIGNIAEEINGNLWISTENGGLNYFDRKQNSFKSFQYSPNNPNSISSNTLKALYLDSINNCLWIGTHLGGLNRFNLSTKTNKRYSFQDPRLNNYVRCIEHYNDKLYLGTHNAVYVFDINTEKATPLVDNILYGLNKKQIWDLFIDSQQNLWFSTSFAVFKYNLINKDLKKFVNIPNDQHSIPPGYLNTFYENKQGQIWIGSAGGGISIYHPQTETFTSFNTLNSDIIDDYIVDINESPMGYLLIATNKRLSRFDYENRIFYNYYNNTFFPFSAINERGLHITHTGEIIISSVDGMLILNEKDLDITHKKHQINLTELYVNNILVKPDDSSRILKESLSYTNKITLTSDHSIFSVVFNVTNYIKAIQPDIIYKLEGFDKAWVNTCDRNMITYTNLNPGKYKLIIKERANNTDEIHPMTELEIEILPPFYKTWIAFMIYFILIGGITYILFRSYISHIKLQSSLIYVNKEKERIEELNQYKLRFFTNISHEFRTPLTLITSQLEYLLQSTNIQQNIYSRILSILKNTDKMKKLINELLDFRKQDQGFVKIKVSYINIIQFIQEIYLPFKEYAHTRHIDLRFIHKEEELFIWIDPNQFDKVLHNLLSNAFKYTPENGTISIVIEKGTSILNISIIDSGIGIDKAYQDKIFNRFYQVETEQTSPFNLGTGIGLALVKSIVESHKGEITVYSELNKGTEFKISLPLDEDYSDDPERFIKEDYKPLPFLETDLPDDGFITEIKKSQKELGNQEISILIVEDNIELLQILSTIFEPLYKVYTAVNGVLGFEAAQKFQPDIILSDVMMPLMPGTEMCKKIKNNYETCHIPVILLTARSTIEYMLEGYRIGADDYIPKPFNVKILVARCNNLVTGRKLLQNKFSKNPQMDIHMLGTTAYDQQLLEKAIAIVEKNIDNPNFDINMFAQEMCLGRTNLFSKLKGITGQTPNDFITSIKLKKSLILLRDEPQTPVAEIAMRVGFSESAYYIKRFKNTYNTTPAQYRKEQFNSPQSSR